MSQLGTLLPWLEPVCSSFPAELAEPAEEVAEAGRPETARQPLRQLTPAAPGLRQGGLAPVDAVDDALHVPVSGREAAELQLPVAGRDSDPSGKALSCEPVQREAASRISRSESR